MQLILAMNEPILTEASTAARWAADRQYQRHHAGAAWDAFGRRRDETIAMLGGLTPEHRERAGHHPKHGRVTVGDLVSLMAWHDDNHVDQLRRALEGKP
jgi:hypothetical protein